MGIWWLSEPVTTMSCSAVVGCFAAAAVAAPPPPAAAGPPVPPGAIAAPAAGATRCTTVSAPSGGHARPKKAAKWVSAEGDCGGGRGAASKRTASSSITANTAWDRAAQGGGATNRWRQEPRGVWSESEKEDGCDAEHGNERSTASASQANSKASSGESQPPTKHHRHRTSASSAGSSS